MSISEIAKRLGMAENTARRYANLFGDYIKSRQYGRSMKYDPESLEVLAAVSRMYSDGLGTQEIQERLRGAYTLTVNMEPENDGSSVLPPNVNTINEIRETMLRLALHIERQEVLNQALVKELSDQRAFIEQSIKERDEKLMGALRALTEAKQEAAAAVGKKWWKWW